MKQASKKGDKNKIGADGEQITVNYLKRHNFTILETNYLKKWGEIDVIAKDKASNIHFVEVKTVSYETKDKLEAARSKANFRPEENVHHLKLLRLQRAIESWLMEHSYDGNWQIDIAAVKIVPREKYATIKILPNVII